MNLFTYLFVAKVALPVPTAMKIRKESVQTVLESQFHGRIRVGLIDISRIQLFFGTIGNVKDLLEQRQAENDHHGQNLKISCGGESAQSKFGRARKSQYYS